MFQTGKQAISYLIILIAIDDCQNLIGDSKLGDATVAAVVGMIGRQGTIR